MMNSFEIKLRKNKLVNEFVVRLYFQVILEVV
jgi:hypothetical protein